VNLDPPVFEVFAGLQEIILSGIISTNGHDRRVFHHKKGIVNFIVDSFFLKPFLEVKSFVVRN
jgi:hypothetical protein